jgi:two-component system phosphate regulon response regulator PhoB
VEDEADLGEMVRFNLEREGYACRHVQDGQSAIAALAQQVPDLVIMDRMLPFMSGDDLTRRLKRDPRTAGVPVIMLTAKAEESDELVGFALGADDYVRKPFSVKLLLARVAAVLRREDPAVHENETLRAGPVTLDRSRHEVRVAGAPISLTATEFRILRELMAASGRVRMREQLIDSVLGVGVAVTNRTIDVHIAALRKKLGKAAGWIQTIRSVGYAFRAPSDDSTDDA